ncbi:MAG: hypothetical protein GX913_03460 [Clostridiales bacterium]|nr:hypothetical protein [Clostridiales bacterium]
MDTIETGIYMGASIFLFIMAMTLLIKFVELYDDSIMLLNQNINSEHVVMEKKGYE